MIHFKNALIGYLEFDDSTIEQLKEPKKIVTFKNEKYISIGLGSVRGIQYTYYHKLYEFFGDPDKAQILYYIYKDNSLISLSLKKTKHPIWFDKVQKKIMNHYYPEYFL